MDADAASRETSPAAPSGGPRQWLQAVAHTASTTDFTVPFVLAAAGIACGLAGWSVELLDGSFKSISEIIIRVIGSFVPNPTNVTAGNWISRLGAVLATLATVTGALTAGLGTLGEALTKVLARHVWSDHTIVVGDTSLARRVAAGFLYQGNRVLHVVPRDAAKTLASGPVRVRIGGEPNTILTVAAPRRAKTVVIDTGTDIATLGAGKSLLNAFETPAPPANAARASRRGAAGRPDTLALCVGDVILSNQFFESVDTEWHHPGAAKAAPLRPTIFDENRVIARHALARDPLFAMAAARQQHRVHAVIVGFGDLGEKLLDQVMLTSVAGSLAPPRVSVLDAQAQRREREFRARRPRVLDQLDIVFLDVAIGLDPLEDGGGSAGMNKLMEIAHADAVTAFFVALADDANTLRVTLLLRQFCERMGVPRVPVFYRVQGRGVQAQLLEAEPRAADGIGRFISMNPPIEAVLMEIADPLGRDALARALHESYLQGANISDHANEAWEQLPETLRRANFRAADHLPAKLWTLGIDVSGLAPGSVPALDAQAQAKLGELCDDAQRSNPSPQLVALARLEHERWMIERKLAGWTYGPTRDTGKRLHELLVPWEALSPEQVAKDIAQVQAALRVALKRWIRPAREAGPKSISKRYGIAR